MQRESPRRISGESRDKNQKYRGEIPAARSSQPSSNTLSLPLLTLIHRPRGIHSHFHLIGSTRRSRSRSRLHLILLNFDPHVPSIPSLPPITLILANALVSAQPRVLAALTRALTITSLLTLPAALAARLRGEILFVLAELVLEVQRGCDGCLARVRGDGSGRHGLAAYDGAGFGGGGLRLQTVAGALLGLAAGLCGLGTRLAGGALRTAARFVAEWEGEVVRDVVVGFWLEGCVAAVVVFNVLAHLAVLAGQVVIHVLAESLHSPGWEDGAVFELLAASGWELVFALALGLAGGSS